MVEGSPAAGYPREYGVHKLLAPKHLRGVEICFSDGGRMTAPWDGVVTVASRIEQVGDQPVGGETPDIEPIYGRPIYEDRHHRIAELVRLGFTPLPQFGATADRPARGDHAGQFYYDTGFRKPLFWDGEGQWRDALGIPVEGL
jgi:hypothetical protein